MTKLNTLFHVVSRCFTLFHQKKCFTMKNPKWHVITSLAFDLPHGGRSDRARESDDLTSDLPVSRCTAIVQSFTTSGRHIDFKTGSEIRIALNTCCCQMLHGSIWLNTHTNRDLASARNELHLAQHLGGTKTRPDLITVEFYHILS